MVDRTVALTEFFRSSVSSQTVPSVRENSFTSDYTPRPDAAITNVLSAGFRSVASPSEQSADGLSSFSNFLSVDRDPLNMVTANSLHRPMESMNDWVKLVEELLQAEPEDPLGLGFWNQVTLGDVKSAFQLRYPGLDFFAPFIEERPLPDQLCELLLSPCFHGIFNETYDPTNPAKNRWNFLLSKKIQRRVDLQPGYQNRAENRREADNRRENETEKSW